MVFERRPALQPPVLLLDEYHPFAETVKKILIKEFGLSEEDIIEANTAGEGREILESGKAQSLISGLMFPDGDGISVIANMNPKIPTWVITGQIDVNAEKFCREVLGVIDYLPKPVDTDVLIASLRQEG